MKNIVRIVCATVVLFMAANLPVCYGQDVSGMTGVVTDSSGAAMPDATVDAHKRDHGR